MESDFVAASDTKFLVDNMLVKDDFDSGMFDELGELDLEANFGSNELFSELNTDFQIPLWDAPSPPPIDEPWMTVDDSSSDSGISGVSIKHEPLSPASSSSSDYDQIMTKFSSDLGPEYKIELPMTPPHDLQDPPSPVISTATSVAHEDALPKPVLDVLNTKTKIQPKPVQAATSVAAKTNTAKPLVLTAQEFAKLTAQGILRFNPPVKEAKPGSTLPSSHVNQSEEETKVLKRQQRMIKNRESACLSRRRRKEYMQSLEERLQLCITENEKLKEENEILKRKLQTVSDENTRLRRSFSPSSLAKASCLLSILLLFGLNLSTLSIFKQSPNVSPVIPRPVVHHGRSLLSFNEYDTPVNASRVEDALRELHLRRNNSRELMVVHDLDSALCPSYFNKTESLRLANELNGWVLGHKKEHIKKVETERRKSKKSGGKRRRKRKHKKQSGEAGPRSPDQPYQMAVFTGYDQAYYSLLNSINRRNDTFYVVSFKRDQLLLPATAHNKTMRPRMSLVMPALNLNTTMQPPVGSLAMMQIDCEVMDTRLLYLRESVVPQHMRDNTTTQTWVSHKYKTRDHP